MGTAAKNSPTRASGCSKAAYHSGTPLAQSFAPPFLVHLPRPISMTQPQESAVDLSIGNDIAELVAVTEALDRLGEEIGFPVKALTQLQVALDEVLSNVIKYAWPDGGPHQLRVRIDARESGIEVVITDDGLPFDPRAQPEPEPARGRRPRPGGVGIHLVKQLVDSFDYARIDAQNRVTLTKRNALDTPPQEGIPVGN